MGIQPPTADELELARMRSAYVAGNRLKDYRLSAHHLMRMVRSAGGDPAAVSAIRDRFARGGWLQWPNSTWDHMECLGRDRMPMMFVSHPYRITDEGRADMELFRRAGLHVVEDGKGNSWYGHGTEHVRIEHPQFMADFRRTAPRLPRVESSYASRLHKAAPALLALARERAEHLAISIALIPCVGPRGVGPCLACELREDYEAIIAVINEVEGP